jgi:regulator of RNase E activity RraA
MSIYDAARGHVAGDVLARLRAVSTATAWATLVRHGIRKPFMMGIRPLAVGDVYPMVGRARTLRYVPLREDLLGDEEGVVVIPPALAAEIAEEGPQHEDLEVFLRQKIQEGYPISEAYPPNERVRAEYEAYKAARGR